jgi:hypothetical protein
MLAFSFMKQNYLLSKIYQLPIAILFGLCIMTHIETQRR